MNSNFLGVHHINIQTRNLEQSVQFYTQVLGFTLVNRREIGPIKLVNLNLGGVLVELKEVDEEGSRDGLIDHLALRVEDILAAVDLVKKQGVELITQEPRSIGPNQYCFFFRGPSGEKIELISG